MVPGSLSECELTWGGWIRLARKFAFILCLQAFSSPLQAVRSDSRNKSSDSTRRNFRSMTRAWMAKKPIMFSDELKERRRAPISAASSIIFCRCPCICVAWLSARCCRFSWLAVALWAFFSSCCSPTSSLWTLCLVFLRWKIGGEESGTPRARHRTGRMPTLYSPPPTRIRLLFLDNFSM